MWERHVGDFETEGVVLHLVTAYISLHLMLAAAHPHGIAA